MCTYGSRGRQNTVDDGSKDGNGECDEVRTELHGEALVNQDLLCWLFTGVLIYVSVVWGTRDRSSIIMLLPAVFWMHVRLRAKFAHVR